MESYEDYPDFHYGEFLDAESYTESYWLFRKITRLVL